MKLNNLQVLRGISALLVCCFHLKGRLNFNNLKLGDFLFGNGSIGVPIFFVISGFIMVYTTKKITAANPMSAIKDFLLKRLIRIVPLYYTLTFAWMLFGGNFGSYFYGENFQRLWHSLLFIPQKDVFPVLFLGWSLNYEMFFYVVFAASFLFATKRYQIVTLFFITTIAAGFIFKSQHAWIQMVTSFLNIHFLIGIILGLYYERISLKNNWLLILSVAAIALFGLHYFEVITVGAYISPLVIGLLVGSAIMFDRYFDVKPPRFLVTLGDISFSLYLVHPFVEILMRRFKTVDPLVSAVIFLTEVVLSVLLSKISYEVIEKRGTKMIKNFIFEKNKAV